MNRIYQRCLTKHHHHLKLRIKSLDFYDQGPLWPVKQVFSHISRSSFAATSVFERCSLYHNPLDFVNAKFQLILTLRCERAVPQLLDKLFDFGHV